MLKKNMYSLKKNIYIFTHQPSHATKVHFLRDRLAEIFLHPTLPGVSVRKGNYYLQDVLLFKFFAGWTSILNTDGHFQQSISENLIVLTCIVHHMLNWNNQGL